MKWLYYTFGNTNVGKYSNKHFVKESAHVITCYTGKNFNFEAMLGLLTSSYFTYTALRVVWRTEAARTSSKSSQYQHRVWTRIAYLNGKPGPYYSGYLCQCVKTYPTVVFGKNLKLTSSCILSFSDEKQMAPSWIRTLYRVNFYKRL